MNIDLQDARENALELCENYHPQKPGMAAAIVELIAGVALALREVAEERDKWKREAMAWREIDASPSLLLCSSWTAQQWEALKRLADELASARAANDALAGDKEDSK